MVRSRCDQFTILPAISSELGTKSMALSKVRIMVLRILTFRTCPQVSPIWMMSLASMERPNSRIRPDTKLLTMFCNPRPMPTDRPPATTARLVREIPAGKVK